jgi:hypothetical protein
VSPWRPNFRRRGSWRLIVRGACASCQPLLVSCHFHIRKRQERVLGNVKFSDSADLSDRQSPHCLSVMILAVQDTAPEISQAVVCRDYRSRVTSFRASPTTNESHAIAGMFMSIFEGELHDPRFIELAQAFRYHLVVLFLGRTRER